MQKSEYVTVNLEEGMPYVEDALRHLRFALETQKRCGGVAVKLIHGYGSSGTGGKIRVAVRRELTAMKQAGKIRDYVIGEEFSIFSPVTRRPENPKAYNRQKARKRSDDFPDRAFFFQKNFNILKKTVPFFEVFCYD